MHRLYNLDYLRGIAAFGIMIYHYLLWTWDKIPAERFMGRVGVYGVSIFYVLSGLTLFYVYHEKMRPTTHEVLGFIKKRIYRIFPLLWLVTISAIVLSRKTPDISHLLLNLTGLFGFVKWDTYFSSGVWSIGNELVFYAFFPFFIWISNKSKSLLFALFILLFFIYLYFAFVVIDPDVNLSDQWRNYVNPLNQVFLFFGGFLMGVVFKDTKVGNVMVMILLAVGFGLFVFSPASGDTVNLVTGLNRLIFTFCCFCICFGFYKLSIQFPKIIHKPLTLLGEASYSVYLLHPLIWTLTGVVLGLMSKHVIGVPTWIKFPLSVTITLITSYFMYEYFEKFFIRLAKKK